MLRKAPPGYELYDIPHERPQIVDGVLVSTCRRCPAYRPTYARAHHCRYRNAALSKALAHSDLVLLSSLLLDLAADVFRFRIITVPVCWSNVIDSFFISISLWSRGQQLRRRQQPKAVHAVCGKWNVVFDECASVRLLLADQAYISSSAWYAFAVMVRRLSYCFSAEAPGLCTFGACLARP